jgi:DNA-binding Xre family transcriptional regulator
MAIFFAKLTLLLIDQQMCNSEFINYSGFSGNVMTKVKRRNYISRDCIERICQGLVHGMDDILEFIDEDEEA